MEEHNECKIVYRKLDSIQYPRNFVTYKFSKKQFDREIERLAEYNKYIIINIIEGNRSIVSEDSILIEHNSEEENISIQQSPEQAPQRSVIELVDLCSSGLNVFTLKNFDDFLDTYQKDTSTSLFRLNGRRMLLLENEIFQEDIKQEKDKQYI